MVPAVSPDRVCSFVLSWPRVTVQKGKQELTYISGMKPCKGSSIQSAGITRYLLMRHSHVTLMSSNTTVGSFKQSQEKEFQRIKDGINMDSNFSQVNQKSLGPFICWMTPVLCVRDTVVSNQRRSFNPP